MPLVGRLANAANQRHPFVGLVVSHAVALRLQGLANQVNERGVAGGAIAIAQHKVCQVLVGRAQPLIHITGHGVQVDVPHTAKAVHAPLNGLGQLCVIGAPVARNALLHFGHAELAVIHGRGLTRLVDLFPDQAQPLLRLDAGGQRRRPDTIEHGWIEVFFLAIGIDIGARKCGLYQRGTVLRKLLPQRVHMRVFPPAQQCHGYSHTKICRVGCATVG